ncbi:MAG: NADH dehydrogenase (quinone) subunit D [Acidobacteriota bacterium]
MSQEAEQTHFITTKLEVIADWARKNSLWPMPFGTACCAIEYMSCISATYDIARFGAEVVRFSPRQADLLMVMGTITDKMAPVLKRIYDQMPEPKWVISMGACATSGGFYRSYHVMQGIDEIIPVDVYIPGCPPTPEAVLDAILKLQEKIKQQATIADHKQQTLYPTLKDASITKLVPPTQALLIQTEELGFVDKPLVEKLRAYFGNDIIAAHDFRGDLAINVNRTGILEICRWLKNEPELDFNLLLDICAVDYWTRATRFDVVYHLYSLNQGHRLRLKTAVPETPAQLDSVTSVWKAANWFEREAYDLYGIAFSGHPDLRRILCHEDFQGHPMRKDHPPGLRYPTQHQFDLNVVEARKTLEAIGNLKDPVEETTVINIGPSHPATHGAFRIEARISGETILDADLEIGYLHRQFEKMSETHTYWQVIPYCDRLNYMSSFMNSAGFCFAVEKLLDIEAPPRAQAIRVILSEFSRIMDHLVNIGTNLIDMGLMSSFWYLFEPRERIYTLIESCCGARMMAAYTRIGGLVQDVPSNFVAQCRELLKTIPRFLDDTEKLVTHNEIARGRMRVGGISKSDAIEYGFTGPCLRAAGVAYDVRKIHPYWGYQQYQFDIPIGNTGNPYDCYLVRIEEMRQSLSIIAQALENLPTGPVITADRRVALPPKQGVYTNIEDLMNHFKLVMHGILPPVGEVYSYTEAGNGELGFYIVSDGTKRPYRVKVRPPCFSIYQAYSEMIKGLMVPDAIAILGSLNIIAGELDR